MIATERRIQRKLEKRRRLQAVVRAMDNDSQFVQPSEKNAPTYYDVPLLKPPVWKWEVPVYFFLGGLSAGAHLLARMAARFGRGKHSKVTRVGELVALGAALPCAPLLIADLGDQKRFHYMLRVFKPKSPMNLGAWCLTAYSGITTLFAMRELFRHQACKNDTGIPEKMAEGVGDLTGIPLAVLLAGYSGVLLSSTAIPVWRRNAWLGPMFSAGAVGTGASAVKLALAAGAHSKSIAALDAVENASHVAEAAALSGFIASAGAAAEPLLSGRHSQLFWAGAVGAGLAAPTVLSAVSKRAGKVGPALGAAGAVLGLAGGLALRLAIVQAGHDSADRSGGAD